MRYDHIVAVACFFTLSTATVASAAIFSLPDPHMPSAYRTIADRQMEIAVNDTHLRSKPTSQSTKLATLKLGTKVDMVELVDGGKWAHVRVEGKTGYIRADLLK